LDTLHSPARGSKVVIGVTVVVDGGVKLSHIGAVPLHFWFSGSNVSLGVSRVS
jgi:hypothetical protein